MNDQPIGIFDSGVGGLTVLKELRTRMPNENFIYFGDTGRVPYGGREPRSIRFMGLQLADFLVDHGVKAIAIGCNTVTAYTLSLMQELYDIPVFGIIQPGVNAATLHQPSIIGVVATAATVKSGKYGEGIRLALPDCKVIERACPLLVPIVEEGMAQTRAAEELVAKYVEDFPAEKVETLVLGCTHYPLLKDAFRKVLGPDVELVNPSEALAVNVVEFLMRTGRLTERDKPGHVSYFTSSDPSILTGVAEQLMGEKISPKDVTVHEWPQEMGAQELN